jgi:hypothetical protein
MGYIAVDLDKTLAYYDGWKGKEHIGEPIIYMLSRVKYWIATGKTVKIFTARACDPEAIPYIEQWCLEHLGVILPITNIKDYDMEELWDDRAVQVVPNSGQSVQETIAQQLLDTLYINP